MPENRDFRGRRRKKSHRFVRRTIVQLGEMEKFLMPDGSDVIVVNDWASIGEAVLGVQQNLSPSAPIVLVDCQACESCSVP